MGEDRLEKLLARTFDSKAYEFSKRCGVLIDGVYTELRSGHEKITYECGCAENETQDIVWGFVHSERNEVPHLAPITREPPRQVQRTPRIKVAMQRRAPIMVGAGSLTASELFSDSLSETSSEHPTFTSFSSQTKIFDPIEKWLPSVDLS